MNMEIRARNMQRALRFFKKLKFVGRDFDEAVNILRNTADENGLSESDLVVVTKFLAKNDIGLMRLRALVKCLIPEKRIPDEAVMNVIVWLLRNFSTAKSYSSACVILQWLAGIVEYNLVNEKCVDTFYEVYFHIMGYAQMSVQACKLVYLLTKPNDVNRAKVQLVFKYQKNVLQSRHLSALLHLFKSYKPECVPEPIGSLSIHAVFRRYPDFMQQGFERAKLRSESDSSAEKEDKIVWFGESKKKKNIKLIPDVEYLQIGSTLYSEAKESLLAMINLQRLSVYHLSPNPPCNVLSLLSNVAGNHVLAFSDSTVQSRFSYVLYYVLYDVFLECNPRVDETEKEKMLAQIYRLENFMQQGIPVVSRFLAQYLQRWDGRSYQEQITRLLSWMSFTSYDELRDCVLLCLHRIFLTNPVQIRCNVIKVLKNILTNLLFKRKCVSLNVRPVFLSIQADNVESIILDLYKFSQTLNVTGLHIENDGLFLHVVLDFYETVLAAAQNVSFELPAIEKSVTYWAFFSCNANNVSRICAIINRFRCVEHQVLYDFTAMWDDEAFTESEYSYIFKSVPQSVHRLLGQYKDLNTSFNLKRHPAFACYNYLSSDGNEFENIIDNESVDEIAKNNYNNVYVLMKELLKN